jgi:hypothetical protein
MPDVHWWLICLRAFILAFTGVVIAALVQLSGTTTGIAGTTWLMAVLTGAAAAANAGHDAWPAPPLNPPHQPEYPA